ncbi:MAG: hypothetical protein ACRDBO_02625 [Lachnospiraceae bacterium]
MSKTDYKALLELIIDKSSLTKIQKQLAKENFKINAEVNITGATQIDELTNNLSRLGQVAADVSQTLNKISAGAKSIQELNNVLANANQSATFNRSNLNPITTDIINHTNALAHLNTEMKQSAKASNTYTSAASSDMKNFTNSLTNSLSSFASTSTIYSGLDIFRNLRTQNLARI